MAKYIKVDRSQKKRSFLVPILMVVSLIVSGVGAGVWQYFEDGDRLISEPIPMPEELPLTDIAPAPTPTNTPQISMPTPLAEGEERVDENAGAEVEPGNEVPESGRVGSSYFDDAVFVGDSVTTGITLYDAMSNTTVLAATGLNPSSVYTKTLLTLDDGTEYTAMEAIEEMQPAKVYVLIGSNSLTQMPDDWMVESFDVLIGDLIDIAPNSVIYIQSLTPINEETYSAKYATGGLTNAKIRAFNEELKTLVAKHGVYYLDINGGLSNEDGELDVEDTPDGLHFNSSVYGAWFDYLKTHTVK